MKKIYALFFCKNKIKFYVLVDWMKASAISRSKTKPTKKTSSGCAVGKSRHKQKILELVVLKEEPIHVLKWEACPALLGPEFLYSHHPPFHPSIYPSTLSCPARSQLLLFLIQGKFSHILFPVGRYNVI